MRSLLYLVDFIVIVFSAWTLSYHTFLYLQFPSVFIYVPLSIALLYVFWVTARDRRKLLLDVSRNKWTLLAVFIPGAILACRSLFFGHMNPDDFVYFRDTLIQLDNLWQPFFTKDMSHDIPLPPISPLHMLASYEKLCGFMAILLGIDPLWMFHVAVPFIASFIIPIIFFLIYRMLNLDNTFSVVCMIFSLLFLASDGTPAGSFGNIALNGLWIGKCILWGIGIPVIYLMFLCYFKRPSLHRKCMLAGVGICAIGLNNSAIFLLPMLISVIAAAYIAAKPARIKNIHGIFFLALPVIYPLAIYLLIVINVIKMPEYMAAWETGWSTDWLVNLKLKVLGDNLTTARNLLILLLVPFLAMNRLVDKKFILFITVAALIFYVNPISAPLWMSLVKPASYWRIAYIFPVQIAAGMFPLVLYKILRPGIPRRKVFPAISVVIVIISFISSFKSSALSPVFKLHSKGPMDYRLFGNNYIFSNEIKSLVSGRIMLAPKDIALTLGLLVPDLRFYVTNPLITRHHFINIGNPAEAEKRLRASRFIEGIDSEVSSVLTGIDSGVDAIVVKADNDSSPILSAALDRKWTLIHESSGYRLMLKN